MTPRTLICTLVALLAAGLALPGSTMAEEAPAPTPISDALMPYEMTPEAMAIPDVEDNEPVIAPLSAALPMAPGFCAEAPLPVAGVGATCLSPDGVWRTALGDGTVQEAHEDIPPEEDELRTSATRPVRCVSDPATQKHYRIIYAYPSDKTSRYSTVADTLRTRAREANYILNAKAEIFGYTQEYIYRCSSGTLSVTSVQLPIAAASGTHGNIKSALAAKGYNSNLVKYVVFWDSSSTYCYGDVVGDTSASSTNANNKGPSYATMGTGGWTEYCTLHETFHNAGAVQLSAPHSDGGWHCTDGTDWMCYSQYNNAKCTTGRILDCYADDYCNPGSPSSSNWLYNHWNSCHSRYSYFYKAAK